MFGEVHIFLVVFPYLHFYFMSDLIRIDDGWFPFVLLQLGFGINLFFLKVDSFRTFREHLVPTFLQAYFLSNNEINHQTKVLIPIILV